MVSALISTVLFLEFLEEDVILEKIEAALTPSCLAEAGPQSLILSNEAA